MGIVDIFVWTTLKNTRLGTIDSDRLDISLNSLTLMSRTVRLGKLRTGRDPLILLLLMSAISNYFIPRMGNRDSTWFSLRNSY